MSSLLSVNILYLYNLPVPESSEDIKESIITGFLSDDTRVLFIRSTIGCGQW